MEVPNGLAPSMISGNKYCKNKCNKNNCIDNYKKKEKINIKDCYLNDENSNCFNNSYENDND